MLNSGYRLLARFFRRGARCSHLGVLFDQRPMAAEDFRLRPRPLARQPNSRQKASVFMTTIIFRIFPNPFFPQDYSYGRLRSCFDRMTAVARRPEMCTVSQWSRPNWSIASPSGTGSSTAKSAARAKSKVRLRGHLVRPT